MRKTIACTSRSFLPYWLKRCHTYNLQRWEITAKPLPLRLGAQTPESGHSWCWKHAKASQMHGVRQEWMHLSQYLFVYRCHSALWSRTPVQKHVSAFKTGKQSPRQISEMVSCELLSAAVTCCTCLPLGIDFSVQWTRLHVQYLLCAFTCAALKLLCIIIGTAATVELAQACELLPGSRNVWGISMHICW